MLVATCAAVTVVIAFFVNSFSGPTITDDELASAALSWKVGDTGWKQGNFVWTRYPLPKAIRATKVLQRKLYTIPQYKATARCYDLKLKRGGTARVYVFKATPSFELPAAPPAHQVFTRGKCVAT